MKKLLPLVAIAMVGCASTGQQDRETLARGIYATQDAMDAGRFDLADKYAHETTLLIPPPKHRIPVIQIDK